MERLSVLTGDIAEMQSDAILFLSNTKLPGGKDLTAELLKDTVRSKQENESSAAVWYKKKAHCSEKILCAFGPIWENGGKEKLKELTACYRMCLELAEQEAIETLDIIAIPSGECGAELFQVATETLKTARDFLQKCAFPKHIRIICQSEQMESIYKMAFNFWFASQKTERLMKNEWD